MFGDDRLAGLLEAPTTDTENGTARALLETILHRVERFCAGAPQSDDITLIVIAGRPAAAALPFRPADSKPRGERAPGDDRSAA